MSSHRTAHCCRRSDGRPDPYDRVVAPPLWRLDAPARPASLPAAGAGWLGAPPPLGSRLAMKVTMGSLPRECSLRLAYVRGGRQGGVSESLRSGAPLSGCKGYTWAGCVTSVVAPAPPSLSTAQHSIAHLDCRVEAGPSSTAPGPPAASTCLLPVPAPDSNKRALGSTWPPEGRRRSQPLPGRRAKKPSTASTTAGCVQGRGVCVWVNCLWFSGSAHC